MEAIAIDRATTLPTPSRVRVFVFEATQLSCDLLSRALEQSRYGLSVVGSSVNLRGREEFQMVESDVAIISSTLEDGPLAGFTLLRSLARTNKSARFVMLLDQGDRDLVVEAFRCRAAGVHERSQPLEMICKCVYSVSLGQVWANSQQLRYVTDALAAGIAHRVTDVEGQPLLTREDEICSLVAEGLKNREIAKLLNLSEHTVKNHLFRIFERLGISSRTELILYVMGQKGAAAQENHDPLIAS
jgi:DNA-binding NarL/FixJ family response regulator